MKFKAFLTTLIILFVFAGKTQAGFSEFCDGFKEGYVDGYKQAKRIVVAPAVPACPAQPAKSVYDPKSDFKHGYRIGYDKGTQDGS